MPSKKRYNFNYQFRRTTRMHVLGASDITVRTSIPKDIIDRELRKKKLTKVEFIRQYRVEWMYGESFVLRCKFVKRDNSKGVNLSDVESNVQNQKTQWS